MKILVQTPNYLPAIRYGGPVQSSHGLARALLRLGHSVKVITSNVDGPDLIATEPGEPHLIDGIVVHYYPLSTPRRIYYSPMMRRALREMLEWADILHVNGMFLWPGMAAARKARKAEVPYVVAPRGMLAPELIAGKSTAIKRLWLRGFDRETLRGAAAMHLTSDLERVGIIAQRLDLAPMHLIPNGVDAPIPGPDAAAINSYWADAPKGHRVAFLARLDWKKGVELAVEAALRMPHVHLRIAGYDQIGLRATIEQRIAETGAEQRIRFIGPVSSEEKWPFLAGADVLLVPSINENFGNTVIETLSVGTAVLCTDGVGAGEIIRGVEPRAVVPRTIEAIEGGLQWLLHDSAGRKSYAIAGQRVVSEHYSWDAVGRQAEALFESILGTRA